MDDTLESKVELNNQTAPLNPELESFDRGSEMSESFGSKSSKKSGKKPLNKDEKSFHPNGEGVKHLEEFKIAHSDPQNQEYDQQYPNKQNNWYDNQKFQKKNQQYNGYHAQGGNFNKKNGHKGNYHQKLPPRMRDHAPKQSGKEKGLYCDDDDRALVNRIHKKDISYEETKNILREPEDLENMTYDDEVEYDDGNNLLSDDLGDMLTGEKTEYWLKDEILSLHNVKRVRISKMVSTLDCSECEKPYKHPFKLTGKQNYILEKICENCEKQNKNTLTYMILSPNTIIDQSSKDQVNFGSMSVFNGKPLTLSNILAIDFSIKCICGKSYPYRALIKQQVGKNNSDPIVSYNNNKPKQGECGEWNCYKLLMFELKKLSVVQKSGLANTEQSKLSKIDEEDEELHEILMHKPPPSDKEEN